MNTILKQMQELYPSTAWEDFSKIMREGTLNSKLNALLIMEKIVKNYIQTLDVEIARAKLNQEAYVECLESEIAIAKSLTSISTHAISGKPINIEERISLAESFGAAKSLSSTMKAKVSNIDVYLINRKVKTLSEFSKYLSEICAQLQLKIVG